MICLYFFMISLNFFMIFLYFFMVFFVFLYDFFGFFYDFLDFFANTQSNQVDFVRSAAKKWREGKAKVVTGINLDIYDDQIERSTRSDQSVPNIKHPNIFVQNDHMLRED